MSNSIPFSSQQYVTPDNIKDFDPNAVGQLDNGIFGLPFSADQAQVVVVGVPWEVTTSYGGGTALGPDSIAVASAQVDLFHPDFPDAWKKGIALAPPINEWAEKSAELKEAAQTLISAQIDGEDIYADPALTALLNDLNAACAQLVDEVEAETGKWLDQGKLVALVGGDHSVPLGYLKALAKRNSEFGVLHIDAHLDLRNAYEGFTYSHASIMFNALEIPQITRFVHVGIRDFCEAKNQLVIDNPGRLRLFTDQSIKEALYEGRTWGQICAPMIEALPQNVYVSFDIDGLNPALCPNTGTPVPGGLELEAVAYLIKQIVKSGRKIIGFDLVEVSPGAQEGDEWDANVGARALYMLFGYSV
ncbi:agmatinase [bacterium]|nr:agmatinase [bacterium]